MILEYKIEYRSSSLVYEKIFQKHITQSGLSGKIARDGYILKLYVESDSVDVLEDFAQSFSLSLPNSIFLHGVEANVVESMPTDSIEIDAKDKLELPFCPECKERVEDSSSDSYYDISTKCEVCGYSRDVASKSYKDEIEALAKEICDGNVATVDTMYGRYSVGRVGSICNDISFDIVAYDLATVERYTHSAEYELNLLASFEKPLIKFKTNTKFLMDFEDVTRELIRFKLPDDFVLHLLMVELHKLGVNLIFITKDSLDSSVEFLLSSVVKELEPIEIVASEKEMLIISGDKGLPTIKSDREPLNRSVDRFYSIIDEYRLDDDNIACINLDTKDSSTILVYGKRYGMVEYLALDANFSSVKEVFARIASTNESGLSLVKNYKAKYPELFDKIVDIEFDNTQFNVYRLWGLIAIILGYSDTKEPSEASKKVESNIEMFLGKKGPRIDYKLYNEDGKVFYDALMSIRTAMSFKLAGVDELMLTFGVMESFIEFVVNEIDEAQNSMSTSAVLLSGDMLRDKNVFNKFMSEALINHRVYTHNEVNLKLSNLVKVD